MTARVVTPTTVRRLAIARQLLASPRPPAGRDGILAVVRELGCLQMDPISVVARSPELVLWSRLGPYDRADLAALVYEERRLFEYWAHAASLVPTEDYWIHEPLMRACRGGTRWGSETSRFLKDHAKLRRGILERLSREGPLHGRALDDGTQETGSRDGWSSGRHVSRMLQLLWTEGVIAVSGRDAGGRIWDLSRRHFAGHLPAARIPRGAIVRRAAERSLRALGVATKRQIAQHFTRGRYPDLGDVLARLVAAGRVLPVRIAWEGGPGGHALQPWFLHAEDLPLLDRLEAGDFTPHTTLLSPFDNLICDRARAEQLFGLRFRVEIYVPPGKRKHGYYVMPVLHGDSLVGLLDPAFDRTSRTLHLRAVHARPGAGRSSGSAVREAVASLAAFLGARTIAYPRSIPDCWRRSLRDGS